MTKFEFKQGVGIRDRVLWIPWSRFRKSGTGTGNGAQIQNFWDSGPGPRLKAEKFGTRVDSWFKLRFCSLFEG